jgi:peptidoglycan L-alanyl-D-glutamate endopeptidase CwlK
MASFGVRSSRTLATCHNDLFLIMTRVVEIRDCSIVEGARSEEKQLEYFHSDPQRSKLKWPESKHNITKARPLAEACDIVPWPEQYGDKPTMLFLAGVVMGVASDLLLRGIISHKLRWGGDWDRDMDINDQKFIDLWHFELVT